MSDLKPCPFCGIAPLLERVGDDRWDISCHNTVCSISPQLNRLATQAEAFEQWNTRAVDHSAQAAQFAGLSDVLTEAADCVDNGDVHGDLAAQLREWATKLKGNT